MINFLRMTALAVVAVTMLGCAELQEYQREIASRPVYGSQYMPINGMTQQYPRETSLEVCRAVSAGQGYEAYLRAAGNSPQLVQAESTSYRCRDSLGTITCKAKPTVGANIYAQLQAQRNAANATNSMLLSMALAVNACMAKSGYSMQKVCLKNCNTYQSNSYSPQASQRSQKKRYSSEEYERYKVVGNGSQSNTEVTLDDSVVNWNIDEHIKSAKSVDIESDQIAKNAVDESVVNWNIDEHIKSVKSVDIERDQTAKNIGEEQSFLKDSYAAPKISIDECVLGNSGAYLVMEWTNRDKLGKFRRKFATIANLKAKAKAALSESGHLSKNFNDKNRRYLNNIQKLQEHAVAFRNYAITQGRDNDVALLDQLIDCRE
mgnify:CR=1 FL=1